MLKLMLFCDLTTLNCTVEDIESELSSFSNSFTKVNGSMWFFTYPSEFNGSFLPKPEQIFNDHFEKFTNDNSLVYIGILSEDNYYMLSDESSQFLSQEK